MKTHLRAVLTSFFAFLPLVAGAQAGGVLSGSLESNSILYRDGSAGSNNYLKLDYTYGGFSAGLQAEYYPEPLLGYYSELKGFGLPEKYISWTGSQLSVTALFLIQMAYVIIMVCYRKILHQIAYSWPLTRHGAAVTLFLRLLSINMAMTCL